MSAKSAKIAFRMSVVWAACGKCGISLGENPTQESVDKFLNKHQKCCEDPAHLPRIVGYGQTGELKHHRLSLVLVPEPKLCKWKDCQHYSRKATDYCSTSCQISYKNEKAKKKLEQEVRCKFKRCKKYSKKASDYCSERCKRKSRKEKKHGKGNG